MIYYVEDDGGIRQLVIYTLNNSGFEAVGFEDGAGLFAALKEEKPELILLDLMLPGEDGFSLGRAMIDQGIPVLFLTARTAVPAQPWR